MCVWPRTPVGVRPGGPWWFGGLASVWCVWRVWLGVGGLGVVVRSNYNQSVNLLVLNLYQLRRVRVFPMNICLNYATTKGGFRDILINTCLNYAIMKGATSYSSNICSLILNNDR